MYFTFEISRPFQRRPRLYRSKITIRFTWLYFALGWHPIREDEMISGANRGEIYFENPDK